MDMIAGSRRIFNLRTWRLTTPKMDKRSHDGQDSRKMSKIWLLTSHVSVLQHHPSDGIENSISWVEAYKYPSSSSTLSSQYYNPSFSLPKIRLEICMTAAPALQNIHTIAACLSVCRFKIPISKQYFKTTLDDTLGRIRNSLRQNTCIGRDESCLWVHSNLSKKHSMSRMLARRSQCAYKILTAHLCTMHLPSTFLFSSPKHGWHSRMAGVRFQK